MYNCFKLCDESIESFYGIGFILTDGCISLDRKNVRLSICIHKKDTSVLENLVKFLGNGKIGTYKEKYVKIRYYVGAEEFKEKYGFNFRKTYNPLSFDNFSKFDRSHLLALLAGIVDGDGSITFKHNKQVVFMRIAAYYLWENFYSNLLAALNVPFTIVRNKNNNTINISIQNKNILFNLYDEISTLNIPFLHRKWDRFNDIPRNKANGIPVKQYSLDGNYIKTFAGIEEASRQTGIPSYGICKCCKGKIQKSGGYIGKYT